MTSEHHQLSTSALVEALQTGSVTSRQLTEQCLQRIEKFNPQLNAFVSVDASSALAQADAVDAKRSSGQTVGLLEGLPIGIKDNMCQVGITTTCGSRMLNNFKPPYDATVV